MKKMRNTSLGACLVVLVAASCGFPRLPELANGDGGTSDGGTSDGGPPPLTAELLAGSIDGRGADGVGGAAGFFFPVSVAVDSAGTVYVADSGNDTIRKVT